MAPVMEGAAVGTAVATGTTSRLRAVTPSCLTTTLYDLITALQEVVGPDDDALVVATVVHLLRSGWLTWRRQGLRSSRWPRMTTQHTSLSPGVLCSCNGEVLVPLTEAVGGGRGHVRGQLS